MYSKVTKVINKSGLHARPASDFVSAAKGYESKITIRKTAESEDEAVNAKSIVMLLSLGVCKDEEVELCAKGDDEQQAVDALCALIETGFGED